MGWKQLLFGFFSAVGVMAFLAVVANEVEYLNYELAERQRRIPLGKPTSPTKADTPVRQAA